MVSGDICKTFLQGEGMAQIKMQVVQGGATKRNPDMDKSAVWAGSGCMAVSPISGLRLVAALCTGYTES